MNSTIIRVLYNLITFIVSFLLVPLFLLSKRGRVRVYERFGIWNDIPDAFIWFHGPSLGEMQGLIPIAENIKLKRPNENFLVTITSPTAFETARKITPHVKLLPFDCIIWIYFALRGKTIRGFIFGETEIWPELTKFLANRRVPMFLVNARITDKTITRYNTLSFIFRSALTSLTAVCASDEAVKEKFLKLGMPNDRVYVTGNAKYDREPVVTNTAELRAKYFPKKDFVLTIGSIRPSEEEYVFPVITFLQSIGSKFCIVVAPRHSEKFEYFAEQLKANHLNYSRWSEIGDSGINTEIFLLDTYGKLEEFYSISDLVVIGGTLKNHGGHNPIEAAPYGITTCVGDSLKHIGDIADYLISKRALIKISSREDLVKVVSQYIHNDISVRQYGINLHSVWNELRGSKTKITERIIQYI